MGDGIQRQRIGDCVYELDAQGLAAVAAAVEERDREIEERGLVEGRQEPPAVTTGLEMNTNPEGDEKP